MVGENVYVPGKTFEKMDFTEQFLPVGEYEGCRFLNCNFEKSRLSSIKFIECEFVGCNLSLAKLDNTAFGDVIFKDCKMLGLHFEQANPFNFTVRFEKCMLDHTSFYKVKMKGTLFSNSKLVEVDFTETALTNSNFDNCDLQGAKFEHSNLEKTDFRTAVNYSIDPELNMLKKAKFSEAGIRGLLDKYDIEIS